MSKASWEDTPPIRRLIARVLKLAGIPDFRAATADELAAIRAPESSSGGLIAESGRTYLALGEHHPGDPDTLVIAELVSGAIRPGQTGRARLQSYSELDDEGLDSEYRYADSTVEARGEISGRGATQAFLYGAMDDQMAYGGVSTHSRLESGSIDASGGLESHVEPDHQIATVTATIAGGNPSTVTLKAEHTDGQPTTATLELAGDDCAVYMKSPNGNRWKLTISNTGTVTVTAA